MKTIQICKLINLDGFWYDVKNPKGPSNTKLVNKGSKQISSLIQLMNLLK